MSQKKNRKRKDFCETVEYHSDGTLASFVLEPLLILQNVLCFYIGVITDGHACPPATAAWPDILGLWISPSSKQKWSK